MMWGLLKACYGDYGTQVPRTGNAVGTLDPIECARCLNKGKLKSISAAAERLGATFVSELLHELVYEQRMIPFSSLRAPKDQVHQPEVFGPLRCLREFWTVGKGQSR